MYIYGESKVFMTCMKMGGKRISLRLCRMVDAVGWRDKWRLWGNARLQLYYSSYTLGV